MPPPTSPVFPAIVERLTSTSDAASVVRMPPPRFVCLVAG